MNLFERAKNFASEAFGSQSNPEIHVTANTEAKREAIKGAQALGGASSGLSQDMLEKIGLEKAGMYNPALKKYEVLNPGGMD